MKRIKIFSDFCSTEDITASYVSIYRLLQDPDYGETYCFTDQDDYTHAIIVNKAMPLLTIDKSRVIGLALEPPEFLGLAVPKIAGTNDLELACKQGLVDASFIEYANRHIGKYYIGQKYDLPDVFVERYGYMTHLPLPPQIAGKHRIMSLMISKKNWTAGHTYRHVLADLILKNNLPIDIYGNGCVLFQNRAYQTRNMFHVNNAVNRDPSESLKGEFKDCELVDSYLFTIAIENTVHPHYFSEKIINPLLYQTNVLYYGCSQICEYFPLPPTAKTTATASSEKAGHGIHLLNGDIVHDMRLITNMLHDPLRYYVPIHPPDIERVVSIKNVVSEL